MRMTDPEPPHPGEVLRQRFLRPLGISVAHAARSLGVFRKALSEIVNGKTGISPEMALRLSMALETTPEYWMELQVQRELWRARQDKRLRKVKRLKDAQLPLFFKGRPDLHRR
ncbi:MAG: HigA family addiction module antitoxin [Thermodesulfobacteriota bacterium]